MAAGEFDDLTGMSSVIRHRRESWDHLARVWPDIAHQLAAVNDTETYGQEAGFSAVQVALRAGHDPSVARRHYTGRVDEADAALARSIASLLTPD